MKKRCPFIPMRGVMTLICLVLGQAPAAMATTDVFSRDTLHGWVDIRLTTTTGEASWLEGKYGKLRYGGEDDGASVAEATLIWTPRFSDHLTAYVQFEHTPDSRVTSGVNEAYLKWRPVPKSATRYSARLGLMYPPISLEHDGTGWTTSRTLTPSAINTWVAEEVLVTGLEGTVRRQYGAQDFSATLGLFSGNDTSGTVLSWRGWALHDVRSGTGTKLPLPVGSTGWSTIFKKQAWDSDPLVEVDGRYGFYLRTEWRPPAPFRLNLTYYNNQAKPQDIKDGQYGWTTHFVNIGMQYDLSDATQVLTQYMGGTTKMGRISTPERRGVDVRYDSAYVLISHALRPSTRISARADYFTTDDKSNLIIDNNNELGQALTLALMQKLNAHLDLGLEVLSVSSSRPSRQTQGLGAKSSQSQFLAALKAHF
jgi:Putative beta-barrel porin-2, OmpL-like. bbp2